MAKAPSKTPAKATAAKKAAPKKVTAKKASTASLEKSGEVVLTKLKALDLDPQLQSDLEWCLGSYLNDQNPIGLVESLERALVVFKEELSKKTKGVTAKMVSDIEAALK